MNRDHSHAPAGQLICALLVLLTLMLGWVNAAPASAAPRQPITAGCGEHASVTVRRACIIRRVFGADGSRAVRVAWCESRFDPKARNGQYRGVFQMGRRERARFGHGGTVLLQALAARRYYRLAGWSPWECAR